MTLAFLKEAPNGMAGALQVLSAAESLTDRVAAELYALSAIPGISPEVFVGALHQADFVQARNSEWSFAPQFREEFLKLNEASPDVVKAAHRALFHYSSEADPILAGTVIPNYLFTLAGNAYH